MMVTNLNCFNLFVLFFSPFVNHVKSVNFLRRKCIDLYRVDSVLSGVGHQTVLQDNTACRCVQGQITLYWEVPDQGVHHVAFEVIIHGCHPVDLTVI